MHSTYIDGIEMWLSNVQTNPGDTLEDVLKDQKITCFTVRSYDPNNYQIHDLIHEFKVLLPQTYMRNFHFDLTRWYQKQLFRGHRQIQLILDECVENTECVFGCLFNPVEDVDALKKHTSQTSQEVWSQEDQWSPIEINGVQVPRGTYPAIQRNAAMTKDFSRRIPKPLVVVVKLNGHPARALIDTGSLGDFISSTFTDQLGIQKMELTKPLPLQLAVQGSRSKINWGVKTQFQYQGISEQRYFDVANLSSYDIILGTPC
ncbi:hypothetical protein GGU10DRAFT_382255 [Lentinula aff. detonsa]|uniref:Peptidase A2 domain-containing protein n=1 Tax=Lentinula aff. detonsa TaxID=2804958 RepID=A0AA38KW04_9AGAR|nr:hypothetical protein GGU10DRAFT_382255 [Lentinula aff. detonsa]